MKAFSVIGKNLKLLFRSKESAFTIIFGPLLIILLVSAAYTGGDDQQLRVGVYAESYTPLADQMVEAVKEKGYAVSILPSEAVCLDDVKTGKLQTCILFPPDFRIKESSSNTVVFAVDNSRLNLVYQLIEGLNSEFSFQGQAISEDLAGTMLDRVKVAQQGIHSQRENVELIDRALVSAQAEVAAGKQTLNSVDLNVSYVDLLEIRGRATGMATTVKQVRDESIETIDDAILTLQHAQSEVENETKDEVDARISDLRNATTKINQIAEDAPQAAQEIAMVIEDAADSIQDTREKFDALVNASKIADTRLQVTKSRLDDSISRLTTLKGTLAHADESLQISLGMNATAIAAPIVTEVRPISAERSQLTFTYPYILMLVIMFLGLMLSSSLIVMDKTSRAAFRNFTTATRDEYLIFLSFITTFLILLAQACAILLVSYWFIKAPLFQNFGVSLIVISSAITLFAFLGMIIGYLVGTQEAAMIASLSIGSIFLFISNLVLPLETMNKAVSTLSIYNPYVVLSELLRQSMLFGLPWHALPLKLGPLVAAIVILFLLILGVQRSFKARYFQQRSTELAAESFGPASRTITPLKLGDREVKDLFDLLAALDAMTRAEFEAAVTEVANPIAAWVKNEIRDKSLARKLDTRSKERMILALDLHLKKLTKKLAKER